MRIDIVTIFPYMFSGFLRESMMKRAQEKGAVEFFIHDLRRWSDDKHQSVDAPPFGGGPGMVMRVDVVDRAVNDVKTEAGYKNTKVILLDTKGKIFKQATAEKLAQEQQLILIAPHYEGIDHRVHEHVADEVLSIGEYVLTGGELPAMAVADAVVRLLPGVLGNPESLTEESYSEEVAVEYPQYTRPRDYKGWGVPEILLSGDHGAINKWRQERKK